MRTDAKLNAVEQKSYAKDAAKLERTLKSHRAGLFEPDRTPGAYARQQSQRCRQQHDVTHQRTGIYAGCRETQGK